MESEGPVLLQLIRLSLKTFPALQLAIEQGMGGSIARQKEEWMATVVYSFVQEARFNVEIDELADYVAEILDNEFDTVVADGSLDILARNVRNICHLHLDGKQQELAQQLSSLRELQQQQQSAAVQSNSRQTHRREESSSHSRPDLEVGMDVDSSGQEADAEGWTLVQNKKRH